MVVKRVWALFVQEFFLVRRSLELIMDFVFFSIFSTLVFGYASLFLAGTNSREIAYYFLVGLLMWEVVRITQYSVSISSLWNIWSRNLSNMFIAPISIGEFLLAQVLASTAKAAIMFISISLLSLAVFHFNIFSIGWINVLVHFLNLSIFGWSTGILVLGAIFRYGTSIQALAWGFIFLFQPLTAAFFPLSVLPGPVQKVALLFPPTYVFEAARHNIQTTATDWPQVGLAFALNIFYLFLALIAFRLYLRKSKQTGQFARNEG